MKSESELVVPEEPEVDPAGQNFEPEEEEEGKNQLIFGNRKYELARKSR
jgi:hypothetical protein